MKFWKMALCAAAASVAMGGAAFAQEEDDGLSLSYNVGVASDYVYRGVSQTDGPQIFGGVDLTAGAMYAGAWASNVDFGDDTDAEIDIYLGVKPELGAVGLDLAVIYYGYVGEPKGSDYEFVELKAAASVPIGPASVGIGMYYSPDFFGGIGEAFYYEVNGGWTINDKWSLSGAVGEQTFEVGGDYTTWNLGVAWAPIDYLTLDLRYHDSDLGCGNLCDSRVVLTLKSAFP
ncbi:MAG: TorF family putative porin [Caulobacter sp.]|jgi:uncharacterized protein (TIGR02001 family)